jgi:AcrR family transcriptional regulator
MSGPPAGSTKGDRTRQSLITAGIVRFAREGYRGSAVADICRDVEAVLHAATRPVVGP